MPVTHTFSYRGLLILSVMLNVALALWLLNRMSHSAKTSGPTPAATAGADIPGPATNPVLNPPPDQAAAFRWSDIESADYHQYVANLRAVGCPEQTLRDLVLSRLNQQFASRRASIYTQAERAYWQKPRSDRPTPEQFKKLMALEEEKGVIFATLFVAPPSPQDLIDTLFLQVHSEDEGLLFLSDERREAALQALSAAKLGQKEAQMRMDDPNTDPERTLFNEKLEALARVLSPDELEEYRLRSSPRAQWLRNDVDYFKCTREEFKSLLDLRDRDLGSNYDDLAPDRAKAIDEVRGLFGDERAREFERVSDLNYSNARRAAERAGASGELADRAGQISLDTQAAAARLASEAGLSADERQSRLQSLQAQTEAQLNQVLGEQAATGVRRFLRTTLYVTLRTSH